MKQLIVEGYIIPTEDQEVYDYFNMPASSPRKVRDFLASADGDEVELIINSTGGDVWAAVDMVDQLKRYANKVTAYITGLAASAATIVMCGADTVVAYEGAQFMIHNAQTIASGDYRDMATAEQMVRTASENIRTIYATKTGLPPEAIQELLDKETWMTAADAKDKGFVDSISEPQKTKLKMAASLDGLPDIEQMRALFAQSKSDNPTDTDWLERASARLAIENIRYEFISTERGK